MAIETTGVFGPRTTECQVKLTLLHILPRDYQLPSNDQGGAASMLGTMMVDNDDEEFFV